jgi:Protein of unknown function DUF115
MLESCQGITESKILPLRFSITRPIDLNTGEARDQTGDAINNSEYAESLGIPVLKKRAIPRLGRALIVGGAPSLKENLGNIKELIKDHNNEVFAVNWAHTWLLKQGVIPKHCVFFEIDPEPETILQARHPDITYHICCHCNKKTFDSLDGYNRVLWYPYGTDAVGGGITTFTRTLSVALFLGFRHLDLFGCDSSFPDNSLSTHVEGYETEFKPEIDGKYVYATDALTGASRRFRSTSMLTFQVEEFKQYCESNHAFFSMKVHGDSLLRYTHEAMYPQNYSNSDEWTLNKS